MEEALFHLLAIKYLFHYFLNSKNVDIKSIDMFCDEKNESCVY